MRPFFLHTFTVSLLTFSALAQASDFQGTRCHIRMDNGQRQEIYFNQVGQSVESRLGKISVPKSVNTLQFDQDVYEINNSGVRSELTGSMRIKTFGMDESDENMQDDGINKYTQDFDVNIAAELYLRKDQEQGVLTCADIGKENARGNAGIETVQTMPEFYNQGQVAQARIDSLNGNGQLAKASVDTKLLVQGREANFLKLVIGDVAKMQFGTDNPESLDEVFVRKLEEAKIVEKDTTRIDLESMSMGSPVITISSANKNNLEIVKRTNGKEYSVIKNQNSNLNEELAKANMLIPGFSAIIKDTLTERKITFNFTKSGRSKIQGRETSQGSIRAAFYSAGQYSPTLEENNVIVFGVERDEFGDSIKAMGQPMAEVKLASPNSRNSTIKLDEQRIFTELMEAISDRVKKNPPTKEEMQKALDDSGLEKKIDATQLGMARLVFAESLRIMFNLEANKDSRITKILEQRLEDMIATKAKRKEEKMLVKLMFTDRMKVVAAVEREMKINLNISKQDDLKAFQSKIGVALQKIQSKKQQERVTKRLQAWILKQKVSFNGLLSWTGLDQQTADNRKQVIKLLMGLLDVTQNTKNMKMADIRSFNEDFARMLISLSNKG